MKYLNVYFLSLIITLALFLNSCKKEDIEKNNSPYLTVNLFGVGVAANLSIETLEVIKNQMIEQNRAEDTLKLFRTYDKNTGKLLINVENAVYLSHEDNYSELIDSSLIIFGDTIPQIEGNLKSTNVVPEPWNMDYLQYKAHVQELGWLEWQDAGGFAGTRAKSYRMEAFTIATNNPNIMIRPDLQYRAYVDIDGWLGWMTWNKIAGTTKQHRTMRYLQIKNQIHLVILQSIRYILQIMEIPGIILMDKVLEMVLG